MTISRFIALALIALSLSHNALGQSAGSPASSGGGGGSTSCSGDINSGCNQVTGTHLSGPLPFNQGGTNAATAGAARTNLGAAASGANADITGLSALSSPIPTAGLPTVPVNKGGTNATAPGATAANNIGALAEASNLSDLASATTARANLSAAKSGANSDITSLTGLTTVLSIGQGGTAATALGPCLNSSGGTFNEISPPLTLASAITTGAGTNFTAQTYSCVPVTLTASGTSTLPESGTVFGDTRDWLQGSGVTIQCTNASGCTIAAPTGTFALGAQTFASVVYAQNQSCTFFGSNAAAGWTLGQCDPEKPAAVLPTGSGNKFIATPLDGSSAASALRAIGSADLPVGTNAVKGAVEGDGSTVTCVAGVCSTVGGSSGTVTSVATGACLMGGPVTTTGTISGVVVLDARTTTTEAIIGSDNCKLVTLNNSGATTASIAQAGTTGFASGWTAILENKGAGTVTLTPTTSAVNGAPTLSIAQNTGCQITSDGANYQVAACTAIAPSGGGSGTVTSVATSGCVTGGTITVSGTLSTTQPINAQTGVTYTVAAGDACKLVTFSNALATAVTLPQAGTTGFLTGFSFIAQNKAAGVVTFTPTTSTINGSATITLAQNTGCHIVSDGTNYQVDSCTAIGAGAGTVTAIIAGTNVTITGGSPCTTSCTINASGGGTAEGVFTGSAATGGTANAQTLTTIGGNWTNVTGNRVSFIAGAKNTSTVTLAIDGQSAVAVVRQTPVGTIALSGSELLPNVSYRAVYDGTSLELVGNNRQAGGVSGTTSTASGTRYEGLDSTGITFTGVITNFAQYSGGSITISNCFVFADTTPATTAHVWNLYTGATTSPSASSITISIAAGQTSGSDVTHMVTVPPGNFYEIGVVEGATGSIYRWSCTVTY